MRERRFQAALASALLLVVLCGCQMIVSGPDETLPSYTKAQSLLSPAVSSGSDASNTNTITPTITSAPAVSSGSDAPNTNTTAPTTTSVPLVTLGQTTEVLPPAVDPPAEPENADLVLLSDYLPEVVLDIRYATTNNFTGQVIYDSAEPRLRYGTIKKLRQVCAALEEQGYRLVIWDAWRPAEAQWKLWNICPDPTYVSNPNNGYSSHTRGGTVDITLIKTDGNSVEMPTDFDDFSKAADLDFSDVSQEAAQNARLLQQIMIDCGFRSYNAEWWHFTDTTTYEVLEALSE